ncbi:hypothetical protein EJ05DRAFT_434330 [Pseudovirgaria hyperparasitica]|uniref:Tetratricopeptide repeat domain-containing protein n=1 Tax=Pseudovirgaria hyperparasitica TaxID=470096 RepID=A0A6A6WI98_9PEZI|nr:uncharacterized protein EJ05DRAFT_434330 [Pseudovirgaria hyperparasitica]KAF2761716.1 hypothetical protein EJ05DRAFT_434330 [Pseudovirgaria hyperparasitica]
MVFKTLHLARQSLAKTFTHGYAQSVVAASQSSYASQNHSFGNFASRFKSGPAQNYPATNQHGVKVSHHDHNDSGLAAYYAAWQKHNDKEWSQFQFTKRIEWKPEPPSSKAKATAVEDVDDIDPEDVAVRSGVNRAYSTSAVDDFRKVVGDDGAEAAALARVDEAIAEEVARSKDDSISVASPKSPGSVQESTSDRSASPASISTAPSSTSSEAEQFVQHLVQLAENKQYAEISVVFEAMLKAGIKPPSSAYNILLTATINTPRAKHQVVPKALDVYSDMLRRRVTPDSSTYATLIEVLSVRSLDVVAGKQALEEKRARYGGMDEPGKFMFESNEADFEILREDDSVGMAVKVFDAATSSKAKLAFSERTYRMLVIACAEAGHMEHMVRVFAHMENHNVLPSPDMFVSMIQAFGKSGDLRSAVECYDEYKNLAISHDSGKISISRKDNEVYASLIKAYSICDRLEGASEFMDKIEASLVQDEQLVRLRDVVGLKALVPQWLKVGSFEHAMTWSTQYLSPQARVTAFAAICIRAADVDNIDAANKAFDALPEDVDLSGPAMAMGAMNIRAGNVEQSDRFWKVLEVASTKPQFIEATAMHAIALIGSGQAERGLRQARQMMARIRDSQSSTSQSKIDVVEQIDEAIEVLGHFMIKRGIVLPAKASMELMWSMIENGGLVAPVAGHLLAGLGPEGVAQLGWDDLSLLVQVQAGMLLNSSTMDIANSARLAHLLEVVMMTGLPCDNATTTVVEKALMKLDRPDISQRWQTYRYPVAVPAYSPAPYPIMGQAPPAPVPVAPYEDNHDPYAATTDNKGSVAITDLLEKTYGEYSSHLNEALSKFKNIRRAGRHPRFFTYAKLITAAAKENRFNLCQDILALAKQDVPLLPQYRIVRYGWVTILDAMVAASLTTGQRQLAAKYHQDLLDLGAAPSANTFGLYITTLKESTKTFDEATEAVKIFLRAKSEGVEPSSFLYNALIGKLGKARRIDDCLFYFAEMRNLGIRPTSVTYGTIVNALCRVSDEKFAEELFEEMESMPNYKPRPAPYHSMMQFFLTTKRDRSKVLAYYERMRAKHIEPTTHTYKLLIDTYATLEPVNMDAAEAVLRDIRSSGVAPEAVHYSSLIHAKGCVQHDMEGARKLFDEVLNETDIRPQACLYQALFESMAANHKIAETDAILRGMISHRVEMTPYIANSLIHGWAMAKDIEKAKAIYDMVPADKREPSTYEAMTRAYMAVEDRTNAVSIVNEGLSRGYPAAVAGKIMELVGGGRPAGSMTEAST